MRSTLSSRCWLTAWCPWPRSRRSVSLLLPVLAGVVGLAVGACAPGAPYDSAPNIQATVDAQVAATVAALSAGAPAATLTSAPVQRTVEAASPTPAELERTPAIPSRTPTPTHPSAAEIAATLRDEVEVVLASYGEDIDLVERMIWSRGAARETYRTSFNAHVLRAELAYLQLDLPGHFPAYALWLRFNVSAPPSQGPTMTPNMLRGWVDRFAAVAANPRENLVERLRSPLPPAKERGKMLATAIRGREGLDLRAVSAQIDRLVARDPALTAEQRYYLGSLASEPTHGVWVFRELFSGSGAARDSLREMVIDLADAWLADPILQNQPFFQYVLKYFHVV